MKKQGADVIGAKAGAKPKKPYIQKDTIGSTQNAEIVYGVGDGENGGLINGLNSIILDGTRVIGSSGEVNFNEVKYEERFGLIDQPPLKLIEDTITERGLNLEVRAAAPVVASFNNKDVDKFVVRISVPSLMQNKDNGDSVAASISYAIDISVDGGAYHTVVEASATEKITNGYEFDHEIEAPEGSQRTIRVRRTTPDSTSQLLINKFYVAAISEVINAKFSHPTLHHIGLVFNAEQFNNIPKVVFHYYGRKIKVPVNYNPTTRQYDGIWNGTFKVVYSNNPAWVLFDILTDRRSGLGRRIPVELVDKWELYRIGQYCDELVPDGEGGMEPRFVCNNLVLNSKQDAYQVLKDIASIFRGQSFWNGSQVVTVADAPRDIDYAISMASVISYSYSGTARNARHNVVKVQYYDKNNENSAAYEYATDYDSIRETEQINEVEIRAFGCTSAGQAQRLARYTLLSEQTETRILTAKLSMDAFVNMQIGDVFAWSDKFLAGANNGGRVVAVNGAELTLDRDVTGSALVGDTLFVNTTSGKASTRTITAINGNKVTLDAVMATTEPEFVWVIDSADLSLLYFKLDDYKVNPSEGTVDIVGIQHVNSKFGTIDTETALEAPPFSKVEIETLRAPGNVTTNYNVRVDQGMNIADLYVAWGQVKGATRYTVEFRRDDQAWRILGTVTGLTHTIENVSAGIYEVRVRAADAIGNLSPYGFAAPINVAGVVLPPPKLTYFTAEGRLLAIATKWTFPAGTEASLAVVIEHATQDPKNVGVPTQKLNIPYPQTEYVFNGLGAHTQMWFRAAIVDKYNQEGEFTAWTTATADANPEELIDLISGHISEGTLDQTLKGKIDGASDLAGEAHTLANQAKTAASNAQTAATNAGTAAADAAGKATAAANAVAKEVTDRVAAVTAETNARTAAISKEATDRATALTTQANTLKADSAAKVKALKDEVDPMLLALQDGITEVTTDYKAGDTAVVGQLNAYKTSNDSAVASVLQKAESAVSTGETNSSAITALAGSVSAVEGSVATKAEAAALTALTTRVTSAEGVNTSQGSAITTLQNSVNHATTGLASKASSAALTAVDNKVTAANGRIDTTNSNVTTLTGRVSTVEGAVSTKAEAAALTALTTRVTSAEGVNTSQGSAITSLENSVNHATTGLATKASSSALTAVDNKVTAANGRIDTTNSNVTTLTGRVSTVEGDIAKKADASALTALTTRVADEEGKSTSQGSAITALQNTVNHATTGLSTKASSSALTAVDNKVTAVDGRVTTTNSNVATLTGRVSTVEGSLTTKADVSAVNALNTRVGTVEGGLSTQASDITSLKSSIAGTAESVTANGSQATLDAIGQPAANALLSANADSMTGSLVKLKGAVSTNLTNTKLLIDPTKLYKLRMRYRRTAGTTNRIYIAVINYNAAGNQTVTASNGLNPVGTQISNAIYPIAYELPALNVWREVDYYFKGKATGISTGTGTLADPRKFPALAATVDIGVLANYQIGNDLTQEYEIDYLIFEDATNEAANNANAAALSTTDTEVSRINGVVSGHTTQISNLTTSIAGKADASALNSLTARVATEEGKSTSQGTAITNLENAVNHSTTGLASKASSQALTTLNNQVQHSTTGLSAVNTKVDSLKATIENTTNGLASKASSSALDTLSNKVNHSTTGLDAIASKTTVLESGVTSLVDLTTITDNRATDQPPQWYRTNYPKKSTKEFKTQTVIGVSGFFSGTFCTLETSVPYATAAAGATVIQTATSSADPSLYVQRFSTGTIPNETWTAWAQPIKDLRDGLAGKAAASAVESLTTRVSTAEGTIGTEATKLTTLSTTVGGHTTTINSQTTSINGIRGVHALKFETNGVISGYGLISELVNGTVKSQFGINANNFFIGAPSSNKKPFIVLTTSGQINGVTVPAGTYIDTAMIGNATIKTAQIGQLEVKTANIDNGAITTAKIGNLQVDTLQIKDDAVTVPIGVSNTTANSYNGIHETTDETSIQTWANGFGQLISASINRTGGKCRIDGSITLEPCGMYADQGGTVNNNVFSYCNLILILYRNNVEIKRFYFPANKAGASSSSYLDFGGMYNIVAYIDGAMTGTCTYSIKAAFGRVPSAPAGVMAKKASSSPIPTFREKNLSILELKK